MGTLKYALLGLLNQKKMTGYDLSKEFEETLSEFWYAKHSQIYPELNRLAEEGLAEFEVETVGTSLQKKVYSITDSGREDFLNWMTQDVPLPHTPKSEFRLRVFFSSSISAEARHNLLVQQLENHQKRLLHLHHNSRKFVQVPSPSSVEFGDYMVLLGGIMREEYTCNWLAKCLELCSSSPEGN